MASASEWQDLGVSHQDVTLVQMDATAWLESKGLGKFAQRILEATDAETVEDLKLIDMDMVDEVVKACEMKLVSAKKFRLAVAELRGDAVQDDANVEAILEVVDNAADTTPVAATHADVQAPVQVHERIAICIDRSGSMGAPLAEVTLNVVKGTTKDSVAERTRMEAVKAMFYAFRDRVESMGRGTHELGLLQFDNRVEKLLDLTSRLDRFESIVDDMQKRGQTSIYSAIVEAARMLESTFEEDSKTDLRILVLTDGQNNTGDSPEEALAAANRVGAVVDAIIVGDTPDLNLRKIVNATEGECYQISTLGEGFELLEAEGVVSLRARRGGIDKPAFKLRDNVSFNSVTEKAMTRGTAVQRAPALAPSFARKAVVDAASINDGTAKVSSASNSNASSVKRILAELKTVGTGDAGDAVHIFPAPDSLNFWRVLIEGPAQSPFEDGVFALNVVIPENYPFSPPCITFETPVYHCNVNDSGKICLDILQHMWSPALSVPKCLQAIRAMLKDPDTDNALRQWIAELTLAHRRSNGADSRYYEKAQECTRQDASLTVAEWKQKWAAL